MSLSNTFIQAIDGRIHPSVCLRCQYKKQCDQNNRALYGKATSIARLTFLVSCPTVRTMLGAPLEDTASERVTVMIDPDHNGGDWAISYRIGPKHADKRIRTYYALADEMTEIAKDHPATPLKESK